jgi:hypothetical protein
MSDPLRQAFALFDVDGSGSLSVDEIAAALQLGQSPDVFSRAEAHIMAQRLIKDFDCNGDGELQYDEFVVWWRRRMSGQMLADASRALDELEAKTRREKLDPKALDAQLTQLCLTLDGVETWCEQGLREQRRVLLQRIEVLSSRIEDQSRSREAAAPASKESIAARISTMKISQLRQAIAEGGLNHAAVLEKTELQALASKALFQSNANRVPGELAVSILTANELKQEIRDSGRELEEADIEIDSLRQTVLAVRRLRK